MSCSLFQKKLLFLIVSFISYVLVVPQVFADDVKIPVRVYVFWEVNVVNGREVPSPVQLQRLQHRLTQVANIVAQANSVYKREANNNNTTALQIDPIIIPVSIGTDYLRSSSGQKAFTYTPSNNPEASTLTVKSFTSLMLDEYFRILTSASQYGPIGLGLAKDDALVLITVDQVDLSSARKAGATKSVRLPVPVGQRFMADPNKRTTSYSVVPLNDVRWTTLYVSAVFTWIHELGHAFAFRDKNHASDRVDPISNKLYYNDHTEEPPDPKQGVYTTQHPRVPLPAGTVMTVPPPATNIPNNTSLIAITDRLIKAWIFWWTDNKNRNERTTPFPSPTPIVTPPPPPPVKQYNQFISVQTVGWPRLTPTPTPKPKGSPTPTPAGSPTPVPKSGTKAPELKL